MNCTPVSLQYVISPVFFMALGHYVLRLFLISRKFLKSQNIVYNSYEIKNGITKERR